MFAEIITVVMLFGLLMLGYFGFKKFPAPQKSEFEIYTDLLYQLWEIKDHEGPHFVTDDKGQLVIYTGVKNLNGDFVSIYDNK